MKKKLLTLGALAVALVANAQFISYVGDNAGVYVTTGALVYNGGGMKVVGSGVVDNSGNIMLVGNTTSKFETVTAAGAAKVDGGNVILRMTDETIGSLRYGQLYIKGLTQSNITGIVDKQYKDTKHGTYQQIALPFYSKSLSELNSELGKTFSDVRRSQNEILVWNNKVARMDLLKTSQTTADAAMPVVGRDANTAYFAIGSKDYDASSAVKTVKGVPYADGITSVTMAAAAATVNFGTGGNGRNYYGERYNTYLQDSFDATNAWTGNFGKNLYQFGNPYFTNLDLGLLGTLLDNLQGVRVESVGVVSTTKGGTTSTSPVVLTYASGVATGDVDKAIIRPMQTFVIKLSDASSKTLNFDDLRRFKYTPRTQGTTYSVTARSAASAAASSSTVKQLAVIAQNQEGEEIGRTYYVVYNNAITGQPEVGNVTTQSAAGTDIIGTFEEAKEGGYDASLVNTYWLYINEANEVDYKGKEVALGVYSPDVKSLKFEIRENAEVISEGASSLSSGESFYVNVNGKLEAISNGAVVSVPTSDSALYSLYYGTPITTLSQDEVLVKPSTTIVAFDSTIQKYTMIFDKTWKTADVQVYDMAGKLVHTKNKVNTSNNYIIELPEVKGVYIVNAVSESGKKFVQKIVK